MIRGLTPAETLRGASFPALVLVSARSRPLPIHRLLVPVLVLLGSITLFPLVTWQTGVLAVCMLPLRRTLGLRAFSMASETYLSGTHSAAFVTCPNDTVARDLAR